MTISRPTTRRRYGAQDWKRRRGEELWKNMTTPEDWVRMAVSRRKWREWVNTPIGKAFEAYDSANAKYWQADGANVSDSRLKELYETMLETRSEFLILLRDESAP